MERFVCADCGAEFERPAGMNGAKPKRCAACRPVARAAQNRDLDRERRRRAWAAWWELPVEQRRRVDVTDVMRELPRPFVCVDCGALGDAPGRRGRLPVRCAACRTKPPATPGPRGGAA